MKELLKMIKDEAQREFGINFGERQPERAEQLEKEKSDEIIRPREKENPYLLLGFFEFAIIATLVIVFFPWSLLFCVFTIGLENTKFLIIALLHDGIKTIFAILSVLVPVGFLIYLVFFS